MSAKQQQGMTLLEVLVATGILAVISAMAFLTIDNMVKAKSSLNTTTAAINQANMAQYLLQTDIQMTVSSQQLLPPPQVPEFEANSQQITLLRYRNQQVPVPRQSSRQNLPVTALMRVRWYVRNNQWYRATQRADSPSNSNQWQERPMLALKSLACEYQNHAGLMQPNWPATQRDNSQLPKQVRCQLRDEHDQATVLKLVPWQHIW